MPLIGTASATEGPPKPDSSLTPSQKNAPSEASPLAGRRVVICEDEGILQMQLQRALTRAGLQIVGSANNGQTGVEIVLRERPDIVLMDIRMPIMNGLEAARRILAVYRPCLVMLTAYADESYQQQATEIGASGYIVKPVTTETLLPQLRAAWSAFQVEPGR
ncbi:MAG TPA: response regulator [Chthonomonadaceae bacterium]|nr:response regulator [Chthonomonadaceae bacterium]